MLYSIDAAKQYVFAYRCMPAEMGTRRLTVGLYVVNTWER